MLSICSFRMKPQHVILTGCEPISKPGYYFKIHATFFGYIVSLVLGPQKRSKAPFGGACRSISAGSERRCADTAKWRAFRTFRPTVAPNWTTRAGNKARDPLTQSDRFRNVRWITRPPEGARSVGIALSWCRWTPDDGAPNGAFRHPPVP